MTTRAFPDWNQLYRDQPTEGMPWYYPELDPDLASALETHGVQRGRALDLGTGPGTQAFALAERGYAVTASDLSSHAIEQNRARSATAPHAVNFVQDDVLNSQIRDEFDFVFDRGCFHTLPPDTRAQYANTLSQLVAASGWLFLKCFADDQPGEQGPYRFSPQQIAEQFAQHFDVVAIERTIYQGTLVPPPRALFCALRRRS